MTGPLLASGIGGATRSSSSEFRDTLRLVSPAPTAVRRAHRDVPVRRTRLVIDRHDRRGAAGGCAGASIMQRRRASVSTRGSHPTASTSRPTLSSWLARPGSASCTRRPAGPPCSEACCPCSGRRASRSSPGRSSRSTPSWALRTGRRSRSCWTGRAPTNCSAATTCTSAFALRACCSSAHPLDAARELRAQVARGPASAGSAMWATLHAALPRDVVEAVRGDIRWPVRYPVRGSARRTRPRPQTPTESPARISRPASGTAHRP